MDILNLWAIQFWLIWIIAGWYLGVCKWTDVEPPSLFPVKWWEHTNFSPGPNHFKRQSIQKTYTTEVSIVCHAIQAIIFCCTRKKIAVGKEGSRKCLILQCKWLFQLCFLDTNATILGQPSSILSRWFSADKRGTAPHCHTGREEKMKYNPPVEKRCCDMKNGTLSVYCLHDVRFMIRQADRNRNTDFTTAILQPSNNKNSMN